MMGGSNSGVSVGNFEKSKQNGGIWRCLWHYLAVKIKQGKSEGFDSCDRPSNLALIDQIHRFFSLCDVEI